MTLDEYQELAYMTCTPASYTDEYLDFGYVAEVGELAGKLGKRVRGDDIRDFSIMLEIGDIAWMIAIKARLHSEKLSLLPLVPCFYGTVFDLMHQSEDDFNLKISILKNVCEKLGFDFNTCLHMNIDKLASRMDRGTIMGSGDNR